MLTGEEPTAEKRIRELSDTQLRYFIELLEVENEVDPLGSIDTELLRIARDERAQRN